MRLKFWLLLCCSVLAGGCFTTAISQTTTSNLKANSSVEAWIKKRVANEDVANPTSDFPDESQRVIGVPFLFDLLIKQAKTRTNSSVIVWISNVTVVGEMNLTYQQIPYDLRLEDCHFLDNIDFADSHFGKNFSVSGSTFEKFVGFKGITVEGDFDGTNCHFNNLSHDPNQGVSFQYMKIGRSLALERAEFNEDVTFLRSTVTKVFAAEGAKFLGNHASFESINIEGAFQIRKSEVNAAINFLSARTGVFEAEETHFNGIASFQSLTVNGNAFFDRSVFAQQANFYDLKVVGNVQLNGATFANALSFARATIGGNFVLSGVIALSTFSKDLSVVKVDNLIFESNSIAGPYSLNGITYRLLFAPTDEFLRFVDNAEYQTGYSDVYQNLENYYRQRQNIDAAKAVHMAWKHRERTILGKCTLCLDRRSRLWAHPFRYIFNCLHFLATGYGQYREVALGWSAVFIVIGYFVFRKKEWMEFLGTEDKRQRRYHPVWYSIALFLPIVSLFDRQNWFPKANRKKSRYYLRIHILLGYFLIPIGLAALAGLIN